MNWSRPSSLLALALLVCACAAMVQAGDFNWRGVSGVQKYLRDHPRVGRMVRSQGPIGTVLDIIIDIILILLDLILGGQISPLLDQLKGMQGEMDPVNIDLGL